jgi:hypothetical protein
MTEPKIRMKVSGIEQENHVRRKMVDCKTTPIYNETIAGINMLENLPSIYQGTIANISERDPEIPQEVAERVLTLFFCEMRRWKPTDRGVNDQTLEEIVEKSTESMTKEEEIIWTYLEVRLEKGKKLEVTAKEIENQLGISSSKVGGILGNWRSAEDAPLSVSAIERDGKGNIWEIKSKY